jgi:hypothetical protein
MNIQIWLHHGPISLRKENVFQFKIFFDEFQHIAKQKISSQLKATTLWSQRSLRLKIGALSSGVPGDIVLETTTPVKVNGTPRFTVAF